MDDGFDIDALIQALAMRVAAHLKTDLAEVANAPLRPRLLTVEQAAIYMGRTEEAMQHMIANGKVPSVRIDRRVFIDVRDLDSLIEDSKFGAGR